MADEDKEEGREVATAARSEEEDHTLQHCNNTLIGKYE